MSILALSVFACHAGDKIQFSAPQKPSSAPVDTYRRLLEEDLKKSGSRPAADPIAVIQSATISPTTTGPKGDEKRLRELLDQKKNWIFMDPDSFGKSSKSDGLFGDSSEEEDFSFGTEDTSLIGKFLADRSSKKKGRRESEGGDSDELDADDPFGSFSSDSPIFGALESAFGKESEAALGDSFGFTDKEPRKGWEVLFGSKLDSDAGKPGLFDPNRAELDRINREFSDKMFSGTSFLGDIGTDRKFDADKEFESLIAPGLGRAEGLGGGGGLINQAIDPGRTALNPVVGQSATESIQFSGSLSDFSGRASSLNPTVGSEFMQSEPPAAGGRSITPPTTAESRQSQGVPRLPTVFEIPRSRGF